MMLMNEVTVSVDMAMGDPTQRLQKFLFATNAANQIVMSSPPGANVQEMVKEIYSNAGYRDGSRFYGGQQDPRLAKAMQMVQQLQGQLQGKQMDLQAQAQIEQAKIASNERIKAAELQTDQGRISGDLQIRQAELVVEGQKLELEKLKLQIDAHAQDIDNQLRQTETGPQLEIARMKLEGERQKLNGQVLKLAQELEKGQHELAKVKIEAENEFSAGDKVKEVAGNVSQSMDTIGKQIEAMKAQLADTSGLDTIRQNVQELGKGLGMVAGAVMAPKRKPKGFMLKKGKDQKTTAIAIHFDDGSTDEMPVNR